MGKYQSCRGTDILSMNSHCPSHGPEEGRKSEGTDLIVEQGPGVNAGAVRGKLRVVKFSTSPERSKLLWGSEQYNRRAGERAGRPDLSAQAMEDSDDQCLLFDPNSRRRVEDSDGRGG